MSRPLGLTPMVRLIAAACAADADVSVADLTGSSRLRSIVRPRQRAFALAVMIANLSLIEIARRFGGRDHTTVLHGARHTIARARADWNEAARLVRICARMRAMQAGRRHLADLAAAHGAPGAPLVVVPAAAASPPAEALPASIAPPAPDVRPPPRLGPRRVILRRPTAATWSFGDPPPDYAARRAAAEARR